MDNEIKIFETIAMKKELMSNVNYVPEYWIPMYWASRLIQKSFVNNYLPDSNSRVDLIKVSSIILFCILLYLLIKMYLYNNPDL